MVSRAAPSAARERPPEEVADGVSTLEQGEAPGEELPSAYVREELQARGMVARALPACASVFGIAVLLVAFVELFHLAGDFQGQAASASTTLGSLKTMGYYLGHMLYGNSVRLLVGSALLSIGLLVAPPGPFLSPGPWRRSTRIAGLIFGTLSAVCLVGCILLVLPGAGRVELMTRNLIPALPVTVLVMLVTAAALGFAGYILIVGTHEERQDST